MKINIAVLITCHNRREKTISCLKALFVTTIPEGAQINVFLVDDGSTDGTSEAVKVEFPIVRVIQGSGQLFWNKGMHLAWQEAFKQGVFDFYLWLNDDVILEHNALKIVLDDVKLKPDSIICGSMRSTLTNELTYGGRQLNGEIIKPCGIPQEVSLINGNFVLVPSTVYNKIGMLDPIYPHAISDFDYGLRAKKNNIKSFVSSEYCGFCEKNVSLAKWCLPNVAFIERLKSLYSPLGSAHPKYFFIYESRYFGMFTAVKHFITIHIRVVFPYLWKNNSSVFSKKS